MSHNNEVENQSKPQDAASSKSGLFEQLDGLETAGNMFSEATEGEDQAAPDTHVFTAAADLVTPSDEDTPQEASSERSTPIDPPIKPTPQANAPAQAVAEAHAQSEEDDEDTIDLDMVAAAVAEAVSHNTGATPQPEQPSQPIEVIEADEEEIVVEVQSLQADLERIESLEGELVHSRKQNDQLHAQLEATRGELDEAAHERDDLKNRLLRTAADLENVRRRKEREKEELRKYGADKVVMELLPAVDNLERALEHAEKTDDDSSIADGVKMVYKQIISGLNKHGVTGYDSVHERFDPQRHEAIQQIETSEHETGIVLQEFQRGYFIHDRLLRPALVVVSKYVAPPEPEVLEDAEEDSEPILEEIIPEQAFAEPPTETEEQAPTEE